jgi:hypothetical protein
MTITLLSAEVRMTDGTTTLVRFQFDKDTGFGTVMYRGMTDLEMQDMHTNGTLNRTPSLYIHGRDQKTATKSHVTQIHLLLNELF